MLKWEVVLNQLAAIQDFVGTRLMRGQDSCHVEGHLEGHHAPLQLVGHAQLDEQCGVHPHDAAAAGAHHSAWDKQPDVGRCRHEQVSQEEHQE